MHYFETENAHFLAIQEHIQKCRLELTACSLCSKIFGIERRPPALMRARFQRGRPQVAAKARSFRDRPFQTYRW